MMNAQDMQSQEDFQNDGMQNSNENYEDASENHQASNEDIEEENLENSLGQEPQDEDNFSDEEDRGDENQPTSWEQQKKLFRRQERRSKKEIRALRNQVQRFEQMVNSMYQPPMPQQPVQEEVDLLTQHVKAVMQAEKQQEQMRLEQQQLMQLEEDLEKQLERGADKYDDFEEIVRANHVPISQAMKQAASFMKNADDVLYDICRSGDVKRIAQLPPYMQVKAMWEKSYELGALGKQAKKVSSAPKPTGGRAVPSQHKTTVNPHTLSYEQIKQQVHKKHRR